MQTPNSLQQAFLTPQQQQLAQSTFETSVAPLRESFGQNLKTLNEQLATRGTAFGGLGDEANRRLLKDQLSAESQIAGGIASNLGRTALDQAFSANENALSRMAAERSQTAALLGQKELQQGAQQFAGQENAFERAQRLQLQQGQQQFAGQENAFERAQRQQLQQGQQQFAGQENAFERAQRQQLQQGAQQFSGQENALERAQRQQLQQGQQQFAGQENAFERAQRQQLQSEQLGAQRQAQESTQQFQERLSQQARANAVQDQLFGMAQTGQLKGTAFDAALKSMGIDDPSSFLTNDQLALQNYAESKGLSLQQALELRRTLGQTLQKDVLKNPQRYAGLALDPAKVQAQQERLVKLSNPNYVEYMNPWTGEMVEGIKPKSGKVICTELNRQGILDDFTYRYDVEYGKTLNLDIVAGYHSFGIPIARAMRKSKVVTAIVAPFAISWARHMAYKMGAFKNPNYLGAVINFIGIPICKVIGTVIRRKEYGRP